MMRGDAEGEKLTREAKLMFLLCAITVLTQAPSKRALTVDDLFAIKQVGTPQVSPDGRWVAYTVRSTILKADRNETALWMAPLDSSGAAIPLTAPGYAPSDARWSPDGKYLSFLATRPRGPGAAADSSGEPKMQVWALDRRGGDRKSTRLNSSHSQISYAVFCLKKKKNPQIHFSSCTKKKKIKKR